MTMPEPGNMVMSDASREQVCKSVPHQHRECHVRNADWQTERLTCMAAAQLEMILQASEYEAAQGLTLQEFFDSTAGRFKTETGKAWAAEIVSRRTTRAAEQARIQQP